jgi:hypothetical protein
MNSFSDLQWTKPLRNIIFIVGSASVGGTEKQIINLSSELKKQGFNPEIVFLFKGGTLEQEANELQIHYRIIGASKNNFPKSAFKLIKFLRSQNADVYYLFLPHAILFAGPLIRIFSSSCPLIYGVRGSIFKKRNLLKKGNIKIRSIK